MSKPTLYDRASGNVLMEGTPEYELEYKYKHNTPAEYKKVLNAYRAKHAVKTNNKKTRKSRKHGGRRRNRSTRSTRRRGNRA